MVDSKTCCAFTLKLESELPGINAGSTFDRKLMYARGVGLGEEFRAKGVSGLASLLGHFEP